MKTLRFFCVLGVALSLAGIVDSAGRYFALESVIAMYERSTRRPASDKAFEEMVASAQYGKYAIQIYNTQAQMIEDNRLASIELYRVIQKVSRQQGILFTFLFLVFAAMLNRVSGSNKALQPTQNASGVLRG